MNYHVGQILFLIADTSKVVPIQVIEEVIRTTLDGKEKTYIVKFPNKKSTTADIKKIKGQLFNSRNEVKIFMLNNAKSAIDQMIAHAEEMSINVFDSHVNDINDTQLEEKSLLLSNELEEKVEKVQLKEDDGIIRVDLGNGKFGKIDANKLNNAGAPQ